MLHHQLQRHLVRLKHRSNDRSAAHTRVEDEGEERSEKDKILPLIMECTPKDQERHLLLKATDRVLYKLDDLIRPYVHNILVIIEPAN
jgi:hypothetical protein